MTSPFIIDDADLPPGTLERWARQNDLRKEMMEAAFADFERNRVPGVAYDGPHAVCQDRSYFLEWRPVGFLVEGRHD